MSVKCEGKGCNEIVGLGFGVLCLECLRMKQEKQLADKVFSFYKKHEKGCRCARCQIGGLDEALEEKPKSIYHVEIKPDVWVDVYDVLIAFKVTNPATEHAIKKQLKSGGRGVKSVIQDLKEAIKSLERAIEIEELK